MAWYWTILIIIGILASLFLLRVIIEAIIEFIQDGRRIGKAVRNFGTGERPDKPPPSQKQKNLTTEEPDNKGQVFKRKDGRISVETISNQDL